MEKEMAMTVSRTLRSVAFTAALLLPIAALAANHEVVIGQSGNNFAPGTLTIQVGDTVTFRQVSGFHNVMSSEGAVTSFRCGPGGCGNGPEGDGGGGTWQQTVTFPTQGSVPYFCEVHGQSMSGLITVNPVPVTLQSFDID
jgi:plastocyanin